MVEIFTSVLKTISGRPSEELAVHGERSDVSKFRRPETFYMTFPPGCWAKVAFVPHNVLNIVKLSW